MSWKQQLEDAKKQQEAPASAPSPFAQFVPSATEAPQHVREADAALDAALEAVDIVDAYQRWCGKSNPQVGQGQTESVMISCPQPGHADRVPSAWLNTEKGVYFCGACQMGGDAYDLAAIAHGMENYREDGRAFHELRRKMGADLGWNFYSEGSFTIPLPPGQLPPGLTEEDLDDEDDEPVATVTSLHSIQGGGDEDEDGHASTEAFTGETLDYDAICEPGTFLHTYMKACQIDISPDEYHLFNGLVALSLAAGRQVYDPSDGSFYPNLFVCIVGSTGLGKSRARRHLSKVLDQGLPFDFTGPDRSGVLVMDRPGSGEVLVKMLAGDHAPPGMQPYHLGDVKGYLDFDELSELMNKGARTGSTLKDKILELHDNPDKLSNHSLTSGQFVALRPFCSITTSTQPETMRTLFGKGDVHSGFLNRFIFITGSPKPPVAYGVPTIETRPSALKLRSIAQWIKQSDGVAMSWSPEAKALWEPFFFENIANAESDILRRMSLTLKKIIMLMAINAHRSTVSAQDVERAILLYPFLRASYGIVEDASLTHVSVDEMEQEVLGWIRDQYRKNPASAITSHQVRRAFKGRKWSIEQINRVMKSLTEGGSIAAARLSGERRRGRPPKSQPFVPVGVAAQPPEDDKPIYIAGDTE